jgi:8-oxo-dGTP diphosphatase
MEPKPAIPVKRQRLSAYALVLRDGAVLLTQLSGLTTRPDAWTLPGGGIDHGEDPRDAVVREVYEETGLQAVPGRLLDLHSLHHEGVAPDGVLEDYHAVRVVFEATVPDDAPHPRVVEQQGTTSAAGWVPLEDISAGRIEVVELVRIAIAAKDRWA